MRTIGKILAGACAILFVISGVAALLLFNIERKAFTSEPYKRAFEDQNLYERMPAVMSSVLLETLSKSGTAIPQGLGTDNFISTLLSLLPPQEIKTLTDNTLDSIFAYLNGESDLVAIPLTSLKTYLASPAGVDIFLGILSSQPSCTTEQLLQMTIGAFTGGQFVFCNPPPEGMSLIRPLVESQLQLTASAIPDQITLISNLQSGTENDLRLQLNRIRTVMKFTPALPVILILCITILAVRDLKGWLNWWGIPLLITGVVGLIVSLIGAPIVGYMIEKILESQARGIISPTLLTTLRETLNAMARQILNPVAIQGFILSFLGFGMIVTAFFLNRRAQLSTT
ncbi:MAG TPA: hypothetical protein PKE62_04175 [Anaerolineales bacterium]|nr:hypothetical protein [Anaerolineales bacterium]